MKKLHFDDQGNFSSPNPEPLERKVIAVRLPVSVGPVVRKLAGNDLSAWVREAIAEKLERELKQHKSA